jgi:hypothetical protein
MTLDLAQSAIRSSGDAGDHFAETPGADHTWRRVMTQDANGLAPSEIHGDSNVLDFLSIGSLRRLCFFRSSRSVIMAVAGEPACYPGRRRARGRGSLTGERARGRLDSGGMPGAKAGASPLGGGREGGPRSPSAPERPDRYARVEPSSVACPPPRPPSSFCRAGPTRPRTGPFHRGPFATAPSTPGTRPDAATKTLDA